MGNPTREDQLTDSVLPDGTQPKPDTAKPDIGTASISAETEKAAVAVLTPDQNQLPDKPQTAEAATPATDQEQLPEDRFIVLNAQGLGLLECGEVTEFNMLRKQYPDWKPCFPEISLAGLDLSKIDLRGATLSWVDFSRTTLLGALFNRACLMRAKFNGATITGSIFDGADLMGAEFRETRFFGQIGFFGTNLNGAKFEGAQGLTAEMFCRTSFHSAKGLDPKLVDEALALIKTSTTRTD